MAQKAQESKNTLSEGLKRLPYPAYRLDKTGRFISRSKVANPRVLPVRMRSSIDRYLSNNDRKRVKNLQVGEEALVDMNFTSVHGAIIYRCADGYWIAMRELIAHLLVCLRQEGEEMPPFFSAIDEQIGSLQAEEKQIPEELRILRDNSQHMIRYHAEMSMYLNLTASTQEAGLSCEVTSSLNSLLTSANKILHPNGFRPSVQTVEGPVYVWGETDVIRYAAALMIVCAAEHLRDRRHFSIHSKVLEGEYLFSVLFEPLPEGKLYNAILSGRYEEGLSSAFGTMFFQLLLLEKLATANGWRFTAANAGNGEGFLRITLALPLSEERPLAFNEAPNPMPLMKTMLSFLFPSEEDE